MEKLEEFYLEDLRRSSALYNKAKNKEAERSVVLQQWFKVKALPELAIDVPSLQAKGNPPGRRKLKRLQRKI